MSSRVIITRESKKATAKKKSRAKASKGVIPSTTSMARTPSFSQPIQFQSAASVASTFRPSYRFTGNGDTCRLHYSAPLFQVATNNETAHTAFGAIRMYNRDIAGSNVYSNRMSGTVLFNPLRPLTVSQSVSSSSFKWRQGDGVWTNDVLSDFGGLFTYYKVHSLKIHYLPQVPTSQNSPGRRFAVAWSDDPFHPVIGYRAYTTDSSGNTAPDELRTLGGAQCMAFANWTSWSMQLKLAKHEWMPTFAESGGGVGDDPPLSFGPADVRNQYLGALTIVADSTQSLEVQGYIFAELDIEFRELVPSSYATSAPYLPIVVRQPDSSESIPAVITRQVDSKDSTDGKAIATRSVDVEDYELPTISPTLLRRTATVVPSSVPIPTTTSLTSVKTHR